MRKLAREAVIFALLGQFLATVVGFVRLDTDDRATAKDKAAQAIHAGPPDFIPENGKLPSTIQVPLSKGTMLQVRACQPQIEPNTHSEGEQLANDKDFLAATQNEQIKYLSRIDPAFAKASGKDQLAYLAYITDKAGKDGGKPQSTHLEVIFDEIADQRKDCRRFSTDPLAIRVSVPTGNVDQLAIEKDYWTAYKEARHHDLSGTLFGTLYVGLLGFPAGLVLWIFYRLVRFAVKG